jgi:hypothetical protein
MATPTATLEKLSILARDKLGPNDVTKYQSIVGAL